MTRTRHDQFTKQYLELLSSPLGRAEISHEVTSEPLQVDLVFVPGPSDPDHARALGLLDRLLTFPCLLEPFRNPPTDWDVLTCLQKRISVEARLRRKARREKRSAGALRKPRLWVIAPSCSDARLSRFGAGLRSSWPEGVYFAPEGYHAALIVVDRLPPVRETLWLRLIGRGEQQAEAVRELFQMPRNEPLREPVLMLLRNWHVIMKKKRHLSREEKELMLHVERLYDADTQAFVDAEADRRAKILAEKLAWQLVEEKLQARMEELRALAEEKAQALAEEKAQALAEKKAQALAEEKAQALAKKMTEQYAHVNALQSMIEARQSDIQRILAKRFGALPAELPSRLKALVESPQLDAALDLALEAKSLAEFTRDLETVQPAPSR